ncbi:MAG: HAD-IIA family hydrolase [Anaerolineales bacterium]|nr:HAD-IIA family hydrolase [Chloroflexota bacterium]MBL6983434.1 HAD-IIA family hydrolase [Anaerolineales bacterium]
MKSFNAKNIRALIIDMDGVLWRGEQLIADLPPIFEEIEQLELKVIMATNNSTRTPANYVEKLRTYEVELSNWQVINSAEATAQYLSKIYPQGGPVYVVGESGLVESLESKGFTINAKDVLTVVAGMDRDLNYAKIDRAAALIRAGAKFIGTNPDRTFPTPNGLMPGAGTSLAAIEAASYVSPVIIGKPQPIIFEIALERLGVKPEEALMVGDRLETDIAGGQRIGCPVGLVLSGVTGLEEGQAWRPEVDIIADDLMGLLKKLVE